MIAALRNWLVRLGFVQPRVLSRDEVSSLLTWLVDRREIVSQGISKARRLGLRGSERFGYEVFDELDWLILSVEGEAREVGLYP